MGRREDADQDVSGAAPIQIAVAAACMQDCGKGARQTPGKRGTRAAKAKGEPLEVPRQQQKGGMSREMEEGRARQRTEHLSPSPSLGVLEVRSVSELNLVDR